MTLFDRLRTEPVYNTRAVVQRTGVPADTFRAWERRYGLPVPIRTAGNQRLYSERDIAVIAWLRDQTRAGLTISQAVALFRSESSGGRGDATSRVVPRRTEGETDRRPKRVGAGLAEFRDRIVEALVAYNGGDADRIVEEAIALVSVEEVCLQVLQGALVEIGHRWERQEVGAGAEHFASSFVMRKFAALFNLSQPHDGRGPIVAACVEGEHHEIGLLLGSLFLSRHGFQIIYLGADLPLRDVLDTIEAVLPVLVMLSASTESTAESLAQTVSAIRLAEDRRPATTLPIAVGFGGRIFVSQPHLRDRLDAVFLGTDARETVDGVERLLSQAGVGAGL